MAHAEEIHVYAVEVDPGPPMVYEVRFVWGGGESKGDMITNALDRLAAAGITPAVGPQNAVDTLGFGDRLPEGKQSEHYEVYDGEIREKV